MERGEGTGTVGRSLDGGNNRARPGKGAASYDRMKEFEGKRYTGMQVGRRHKWRYDAGEWNEQKVTPDKWKFTYSVVKRRGGRAPEGSGAPVGTAYRWYILANQVVTKLDANSYTTEMAGLKYKLAHRRADKESWSASESGQRKRLVQILRELIAELENPPADQPLEAASDETAKTTLPSPGRNGASSGKAERGKTSGTRVAKATATGSPPPRARSKARGKTVSPPRSGKREKHLPA
jgi:hypothetical protein